ncbi:MAG: polyprenyl synthetase family protein [Gammaproteobacteria bacterium]
MDFSDRVGEYQARVEAAMDRWLPDPDVSPARLHQAMRYAVLGGGKRVRPLLIYATGETLGIPAAQLDSAAAAVEMIHAYSLIHDDLPAMDDDDLRRGRPTCHRAFDEATAILAGDALQALALEVLAADAHLTMVGLLARASGSRGMAGGQALDLDAEGQLLTLEELEAVHALKTGALIVASVLLAADAAADLAPEHRDALARFGTAIGLAFQIRDDILDVEGDTAVLGKQQGADARLAKSTFPALLGLDGAKRRVEEAKADALAALAPFGDDAEPLRWLASYIVDRNH